ncbi:MAG: hypothetical protein GC145_08010 [Caulobacter sp.]|nr:hypothetical protein [Caulobacter sp.]
MTLPRLLMLVAAAASLTGCASLGGGNAPICDGRHRWPANPHGSTLIAAPAPPPQPQTSEAAPPSGGGCA